MNLNTAAVSMMLVLHACTGTGGGGVLGAEDYVEVQGADAFDAVECADETGDTSIDTWIEEVAEIVIDTAPRTRLFSFAIVTDMHVGDGLPDHGTPGYDDSGETPNDAADNDLEAVLKVNAAKDAYDIRFVLVLGDLTDSGERSEMVSAGAVLGHLEVPWFPILGNHDTWPYVWNGDVFEETTGPIGDRFFIEVYADRFAAMDKDFDEVVAPASCEVLDQVTQDIPPCLINFAFSYQGVRFICLDFNTRLPAPPQYPGIGPEADLFDMPSGTWQFFLSQLMAHAESPILVFSHHPLAPLEAFAFTAAQYELMQSEVEETPGGSSVQAYFAGHIHVNSTDFTFAGRPVVMTAASKSDRTVRVVQVFSDGTVDYDLVL